MSNAALTTRDVRSMALLDGFTRSNQGEAWFLATMPSPALPPLCSVCLEGQVPDHFPQSSSSRSGRDTTLNDHELWLIPITPGRRDTLDL
ncbi:hypothetical protein M404DRAFT_1001632 [Pisolithus tinctorius Marx 270]|uniref:Uncharacterized protein n=1 Tax=Pisolithus tinctorius Marx 270 TaxID=870435 RepID=A0A0C3P6L2_PISTI|nr:hypothetical protein M404DRAFT_1001632 [Pisolithus tinctorius Marx 270]